MKEKKQIDQILQEIKKEQEKLSQIEKVLFSALQLIQEFQERNKEKTIKINKKKEE